MKKISIYLIVGIIAAVFFIYYLFPKKAVEAYIDYQIHRINPELRMAFNDLRLYYPPYLKVTDASVYHLQKPVVTISSVKIRPGKAVLLKEGTIVAFTGFIRDGQFQGKIRDGGNSTNSTTSIKINLDGILLEDIDGIRTMPKVRLSGQVQGKIVYEDKRDEPDEGQADLIFTDCKIQLTDALFDIKNLLFSRIEMILSLKGATVKIKRLEMTGSQADAQFNGQMNLKQPINRTGLNIKGNVRLHAEFMARLKQNIPAPLWPNKNILQRGLPVTVSGTIDNPQLGMR